MTTTYPVDTPGIYQDGRKEADRRIQEAKKNKETELWLNTLGLSEADLPTSLWDFTSIKKLDLHRNDLTEIPGSIGKLKKLIVLNLYGNRLAELPQQLGRLKKLQEIHIEYNQLSEIPDFICKLPDLVFLFASNNRIEKISKQISKLSKLQTLWIYSNKLISLPEEIGDLSDLRMLWAHNNLLSSVPASLTSLIKLRGDHGSGYPRIRLDDNPTLPSPPMTIQSAGSSAVISWLLKNHRNSVFGALPRKLAPPESYIVPHHPRQPNKNYLRSRTYSTASLRSTHSSVSSHQTGSSRSHGPVPVHQSEISSTTSHEISIRDEVFRQRDLIISLQRQIACQNDMMATLTQGISTFNSLLTQMAQLNNLKLPDNFETIVSNMVSSSQTSISNISSSSFTDTTLPEPYYQIHPERHLEKASHTPQTNNPNPTPILRRNVDFAAASIHSIGSNSSFSSAGISGNFQNFHQRGKTTPPVHKQWSNRDHHPKLISIGHQYPQHSDIGTSPSNSNGNGSSTVTTDILRKSSSIPHSHSSPYLIHSTSGLISDNLQKQIKNPQYVVHPSQGTDIASSSKHPAIRRSISDSEPIQLSHFHSLPHLNTISGHISTSETQSSTPTNLNGAFTPTPTTEDSTDTPTSGTEIQTGRPRSSSASGSRLIAFPLRTNSPSHPAVISRTRAT